MKGNHFMAMLLLVLLLTSGTLALMDESSFYEKFVLEEGLLKVGFLEKVIVTYLIELRVFYSNHLTELVQRNPDPFEPANQVIINHLIITLEPLCLLGLLTIGLYLILMSGTPWGRAFSKSILPGLILAILLIPLSSYFVFVLLGLSNSLTVEIFSFSNHQPARMFESSLDFLTLQFTRLNIISFLFSLPFLIVITLSLFLPLALLVVRYLMVNFLAIVFPVTLLLYLFLPTRQLGRRMMELTISWTLVQVVVALSLMAISALFYTLSPMTPEVDILLELAANLTLVVVIIGTIVTFRDYLP